MVVRHSQPRNTLIKFQIWIGLPRKHRLEVALHATVNILLVSDSLRSAQPILKKEKKINDYRYWLQFFTRRYFVKYVPVIPAFQIRIRRQIQI
jgi:hypothetical protein